MGVSEPGWCGGVVPVPVLERVDGQLQVEAGVLLLTGTPAVAAHGRLDVMLSNAGVLLLTGTRRATRR